MSTDLYKATKGLLIVTLSPQHYGLVVTQPSIDTMSPWEEEDISEDSLTRIQVVHVKPS